MKNKTHKHILVTFFYLFCIFAYLLDMALGYGLFLLGVGVLWAFIIYKDYKELT